MKARRINALPLVVELTIETPEDRRVWSAIASMPPRRLAAMIYASPEEADRALQPLYDVLRESGV